MLPWATPQLCKIFANGKYHPELSSVPCVLQNVKIINRETLGPTLGKPSRPRRTPMTGKSKRRLKPKVFRASSQATRCFAAPACQSQRNPSMKFVAVPSKTDHCSSSTKSVAEPVRIDHRSPSTKSVAVPVQIEHCHPSTKSVNDHCRTVQRRPTTKPVVQFLFRFTL